MFGFDDLVDKIQKTIKATSSKDDARREGDDLWVDKYRPQKFTQLITMDVKETLIKRKTKLN